MGIYTNKLDLIYFENDIQLLENKLNNYVITEYTMPDVIQTFIKYWEKFKRWLKEKIRYIQTSYFKKSNNVLKIEDLSEPITIKYISNYDYEDINRLDSKINSCVYIMCQDRNTFYNLHLDELFEEINSYIKDIETDTYTVYSINDKKAEEIIDKNLLLKSSCERSIKNLRKYINEIDDLVDSIKKGDSNIVAAFSVKGEIKKTNNNIICIDFINQIKNLNTILNNYCNHLFAICREIGNFSGTNAKFVISLDKK